MCTDRDQVPGSVADAHDSGGYGTSPAWLAAITRLKTSDARAAVPQMRTLARHPRLAGAMAARGYLPVVGEPVRPADPQAALEPRAETDQILLEAAAVGASLEDPTLPATARVEQYLA
jgi:hypothetical protein